MSDGRSTIAAAVIGVGGVVLGALLGLFLFRSPPQPFFECEPSLGPAALDVVCTDRSLYTRHTLWRQVDLDVQVQDAAEIALSFPDPDEYEVELIAYGWGTGEARWVRTVRVTDPEVLSSPLVLDIEAVIEGARLTRTRGEPVDVVKDDHDGVSPSSRSYRIPFAATPGFRIVDARWLPESEASHSDLRLVVAPDGSEAALSFRLRSGPLFDRWRGWLRGTVRLEERRDEPERTVTLAQALEVDAAGVYALEAAVAEPDARLRITGAEGRLLAEAAPGERVRLDDPAVDLRVVLRAGGMFLEVERR